MKKKKTKQNEKKKRWDYERLDFGAKSFPVYSCDILKTNKEIEGVGLMEVIPHTQVCVNKVPVDIALMVFALEYFRPILEHSRQAFYYFFFWVFNFV